MTPHPLLEPLLARRASGEAIVVAGVGSGLTALGAVDGGADLLACYGTAAYRILGVPTALAFLPYDDANRLSLEMLPGIVERAGRVPVIVGLGAHDPRRSLGHLLDAAAAAGASGVTNEPFAGIYGADLQAELEAAGYGFGREVAMLEAAARRGLLALGWAFDAGEATRLVDAGVQIIGAMAGITGAAATSGADGTAADPVHRLGTIVAAARRADPEAIVLLHGGPLGDPATVGAALTATGADGYATGSSAERTPVRAAVARAVGGFRGLATTAGAGPSAGRMGDTPT
jgi:predicted TIM-barrel enzyme